MTRRIVFCLALVLLVAGSVFAQGKKLDASVNKNAITWDIMPLFAGFVESNGDAKTLFFRLAFAYERLIASNFSIGTELDLYPGKLYDKGYIYFGLAATGRVYTLSERMEKFFIGTNLGFELVSRGGTSAGPQIGLSAGWRQMFGKLFFVEPSMSYTYSMLHTSYAASAASAASSALGNLFGGGSSGGSSSGGSSSGWDGGLRLGFAF